MRLRIKYDVWGKGPWYTELHVVDGFVLDR